MIFDVGDQHAVAVEDDETFRGLGRG